MSEHTASPWFINGTVNVGGKPFGRIDGSTKRVGLDMLRNPVALVPVKADADLIAVAPELLEACKAFDVYYEAEIHNKAPLEEDEKRHVQDMFDRVVKLTKAVLARAEGKEVQQ